ERIDLFTKFPDAPVDIATINAPGLEMAHLEAWLTELPASVLTIFFSNKNLLASNLEFRKSIYYAINRNELSDGLSAFRPTFELLPKHFWGRSEVSDPYNPDKARKFLKHVPKELIKRNWRVPVFSGSPFSKEYQHILSILRRQLNAVGL